MNNLTKFQKGISRATSLLIWCSFLLIISFSAMAQQPAANLDQTRNGSPGAPISPGNWVNGNVGAQNAHFVEGYSIPYRCIMTNLPTDGTVISIIFEYDTKHSGLHALDFITHYDNIEPHYSVFGHFPEILDPLIGYASVPGTPVTWPIPTPPTTNTPVAGEPTNTFGSLAAGLELMTLYGGSFSGTNPITYILAEDLTLANASVQFQIDFVPTYETAILAWGGHIGAQFTWGPGASAVAINGSPYHMRLIDWNLNNLGNQDRSCNADAVYDPSPCDFTGPANLCVNNNGTYALDVTDPAWTYTWSIIQNGTDASFVGGVNNTSSVQVNSGTMAGTFTLIVEVVSIENGFSLTSQCEMEVTVNPAPLCTITGDLSLCPNQSATYSGPPSGITSYSWSINGDATLSSASYLPSVSILTDQLCSGSFVLSLTTENEFGCISTCEQTITFEDVIAPEMDTPPSDVMVQCIDDVPVMTDLGWTDNCNGTGTVAGSDQSDGNTCPEIITRTWSYTDACGNTAITATQTITVHDNILPVMDAPPQDVLVQCIGDVPAMTDLGWTDNCDGAGTVAPSDQSDGNSCPEIITRTWSYTDACGNTAITATQTITVHDNILPVMDAPPQDVLVQCIGDVPAMTDLGWTDNCDGAGTVAPSDQSDGNTCPEIITRTWSYTDACGNTAITATQTITVHDNILPVMDAPPQDVLVQCIGDVPAMTDLGWTDNCDGAGTVAPSDQSDGNSCPEIITRTWSYTDACGNTAITATQTITVHDNILPVMDAPPQDVLVQCIGDVPAMTDLGWTDNCDGAGTVAPSDQSDGNSCPEIITRTWSYTDACGNTAITATQTITVHDNILPVMDAPPQDVLVQCIGDVPAMTDLGWTDNCDGAGTVAPSDQSDGNTCPEIITRTWSYTDACGNTAITATQTITVHDNIPPVISGLGIDLTIDCIADPVFPDPIVTDNCDQAVMLTYEDQLIEGICDQEFLIVREWTAMDACGNISTATQTISVEDNIPLTLTNVPADVNAACGEAIDLTYPEVVDACGDDAIVDFSRSDGGLWGDVFEPGTSTEVCFWGYDGCGNFTDTICITVTVGQCGDQFCTLTQGFYGNAGGTYCNGLGTADLIESLLAQGNLVVGYSNNTMTFYPGNSGCIIDLLPGGGPAKTITGANTCASHPGIQLKKGYIHNILLAQTITMGLNLRLSDNLGSLLMLSDTLVTAPLSGCGQQGDSIVGEWTKYAIPQSVWNDLSQNGSITPTIDDLYDLANKALGGMPVGPSLGAITNAVDVINVAFDECRIGYFEELYQLQSQIAGTDDDSSVNKEDLIELSAYPNPFREVATIQFSVPVSTRATLEVYTLSGMKVKTIFEGEVEGGVVYTHQYYGKSNLNQSLYIYIIRTEYGAKYGKLQFLK